MGATVHDLASELLCRIFDMAVYEEQVDAAKRKSPRTAMALSHTCSFWRQVCISYADLWTFLPVDRMSKELYRLFVERSEPRLLVLYFDEWEGT